MKFVKKNLVVIITASIFLIGVITKRASALFVSLFFIGVIVPIVVVQRATKKRLGENVPLGYISYDISSFCFYYAVFTFAI